MTTYSRTREFAGTTFIQASFKDASWRFSDVSGAGVVTDPPMRTRGKVFHMP